jgi:hypothetical protein
MMHWIGYAIALLAAIAVGWVVPLVGVAIVLPIFQMLTALNPWVVTGVMAMLGGLLAWYSATRQAYWQAIVWGTLWGLGALTARLGVFHWYSLFIEAILVALLLIPGLVAPGWANLLRWYAAGELSLTLVLLWDQWVGVPGASLVFAFLLLALAALIGLGAYRPFEARRIRRRLATLAAAVAVALILWQPVVLPTSQWMWQVLLPQLSSALGQAANSLGQAVSASPPVRWYRIISLRTERLELGEEAKTNGLRQLQGTFTDAHRRRWERGISQIPSFPLAGDEREDLGVTRP